jgi:hypothetical protein
MSYLPEPFDVINIADYLVYSLFLVLKLLLSCSNLDLLSIFQAI